MKTQALLVALLTTSIVFAGCTDKDQPTQVDPDDPSTLQQGKGAIKGLLLDDRYRPIELIDGTPTSEFQAAGFILIQETAEQVYSNADGEFQVVNLSPGTYTLKVQSDAHDAKVASAVVTAGVFTEITVEAQRVFNEGGTILAQENSIYIHCATDYFANGGNGVPLTGIPCDLDLSDDSYESYFISDFSEYGDNVTYMVSEMLANQEKNWEIQLRHIDDDVEVEFPYFVAELASGSYVRMQIERGVNAEDHQDNAGYSDLYGPWDNLGDYQTIVFVDHGFREEIQGVDPIGIFCCGLGVSLGVKAKFLQSVFLGPPPESVDIDDYCVLCE